MGRIILYTLLVCLAVGTGYFIFEAKEDEPPQVVASGFGDTGNPQPTAPRPLTTGQPPVASYEESARSEPQTPPPEKGLPLPPVAERASAKDGEVAARAVEKYQAGDYEGAIRLFKELAGRDKNAQGWIGICYLKLGDHGNAERFLEEAVKENPEDFGVRKALAMLYYKKDEADKGLLHAEAALAMRNDPELRSIREKLRKDKKTDEASESESTGHFKVTFDGYRHGGMSRKVLEVLEDAFGDVGKEFGYFPSGQVSVILYTNREFYDVTRAPAWSGGIYDGKIRIPVRGAEANEALLRKVLFHEYTHSVVRSLTPRCPLWINEGLAEYFSKAAIRKTGQIIPLGMLENSFAWLVGEQVSVAYAESYSAVSFLVERHGFYRMKEFLQSLSGGTDLEQAFRNSFGQTYREFVSSWGKG